MSEWKSGRYGGNGSSYRGRTDRVGREERRPAIALVPATEMTERGTVKWFDPDRRFGFVTTQSGTDAFLHASIVRKYGIATDFLQKDVPVRFVVREAPGLRPEVTAIALAA